MYYLGYCYILFSVLKDKSRNEKALHNIFFCKNLYSTSSVIDSNNLKTNKVKLLLESKFAKKLRIKIFLV